MAFVHSLAKIRAAEKVGWCAPAELGEAAPHYINFAVPLTKDGRFFDEYICEIVKTTRGEKTVEAWTLLRRGSDSFAMRVRGVEYWFTTRPGPGKERPLPYVGGLEHEDFQSLFVEIEPEDPGALDNLYEGQDTLVIGCEPFAHYKKIDPSRPHLIENSI